MKLVWQAKLCLEGNNAYLWHDFTLLTPV